MDKIIFAWEKIYTNKTSGTAKAQCPECIDKRTNKKDKSLSVNFTNGLAFCHYCSAISFRDSIEKKTESLNYKLPVQTWRNYTQLSVPMVKWLEGRKIQQSTAIYFGLTEEKYYQPAKGKEVNNIVFNYFEGETLINKKYRSGDKKFTQSKEAKSIFYNINSIIGHDEAWIVEGEIDCLSMYEIGIKNCISIPNGANDNDNYWVNSEKYLKDIKKFYICTDNDDKGNDVAEKIAHRLGKWKCERVLFKGKDANEDLVTLDLEKSVLNRIQYPVSGTFKVNDVYDDILNLYDNGFPDTFYPKHRCFGDLKKVFSVMRGHLITGTGIPSHGKSNFTEWYVLNLIKDYDLKASFFSPEHHPLHLHQSTFIQKTFGKNFFNEVAGTPRISKQEIAKYAEWANEKIYLTCPDNGERPTWNWLLEKFKEQMVTYGIDIFVIDAFNKLEFDEKGNKLDLINSTLTKLTSFAQINNVMIFLIAHPTKMSKNATGQYEMPSLYDVSGSSDFRNQTHDGFCIYRFFGDDAGTKFINLKTKMSFQGEIGASVDFDYHLPSGRYYEKGTSEPTFNLIDWDIESPEPKTPLATLVEAFDLEPMELLEDDEFNGVPF